MRSHSQQGAVAEIPDEVDELAPVEVARQAVEVPIAPLEVVEESVDAEVEEVRLGLHSRDLGMRGQERDQPGRATAGRPLDEDDAVP